MMSGEITGPIKLMTAVLIGVVCIILIVVVLAGTGLGGAPVSTALISTNTGLMNELPYVGAILATGLVLVAMEGRRK